MRRASQTRQTYRTSQPCQTCQNKPNEPTIPVLTGVSRGSARRRQMTSASHLSVFWPNFSAHVGRHSWLKFPFPPKRRRAILSLWICFGRLPCHRSERAGTWNEAYHVMNVPAEARDHFSVGLRDVLGGLRDWTNLVLGRNPSLACSLPSGRKTLRLAVVVWRALRAL